MTTKIPAVMDELISIDNLPTGNAQLLMRRFEMPEKICVARYWTGLEKPEQAVYVPERTGHIVKHYGPSPIDGKTIVTYTCSECGMLTSKTHRYCGSCGARIEVNE